MIAAAVTSFDGSGESIEDEEIGTIKFFLKSWNIDSHDGLKWTELESRPCEPNDFKYEKEQDNSAVQSSFYETNPISEAYLSTYGNKLKCIVDEISISGNYETSAAS